MKPLPAAGRLEAAHIAGHRDWRRDRAGIKRFIRAAGGRHDRFPRPSSLTPYKNSAKICLRSGMVAAFAPHSHKPGSGRSRAAWFDQGCEVH